MMVDSAEKSSVIKMLPLKDRLEDGEYTTGSWNSEDGKLCCGYSSFRGKRASMEDFFDVKILEVNGQTVSLFGVYDGHGGAHAAKYLKEHLFENLIGHPQFISDTKLAISETYKKTDSDFLESERNTLRDDGSTASTAVLVGSCLYVANVGDSRAVISKAGKAIALSDDHKPNRSDERKRIEDAGGIVMWAGKLAILSTSCPEINLKTPRELLILSKRFLHPTIIHNRVGTWRVGGVLAMSRAFGNRLLKQFVVAEPEIQEQEISDDLEFLVLASDGLWDVVANEDAILLARGEENPEAAARRLTETAFARGSADNITCIVVRFHHRAAADPPPPLD
ncbi:protein phosphatase 2C family protein isoform X1 [Wolffia australiana]